jgi:hypothetical protein
VGNSGITYDALALEHDPAKAFSAEDVSTDVVPTVFYRSTANGLVELVDVYVRCNQRPRPGRVTLALGSGSFTQDLNTDAEFGEQRLRFEVPEFVPPATARVSVASAGRPRHFSATVTPAKKWNVFVVPEEHMDIGYTDYVPKVKEVQSRAIDEAIEMIREHPDYRYSLDSYWPAEQFLAGRSPAQCQEFLRLIREKKIFVPANYAGDYTGVLNLEYLLRLFYHSYKLNRDNGGEFDHAIMTDIPSHSWSLPSVLASAGLKYLLVACNNDGGPMLLLGQLNEKSPFWWEGPDGRRVLTWYARHYHQVFSMFGLPPRVEGGRDSLPTFLQAYARPDYKSDGVIVFGTQVENSALYREQATMASDWNRLYAYPRLKFSGVSEAMRYISDQMADSIPVLRGDGGPYWDVYVADQAYYTALARETAHRVLAAEKFSTISALVNPRIRPDRADLQQLWKGLLVYEEHTDGGGRSGALRARHGKDLVALENARLTEDLLARAMSALADSIPVPSGTVIVFNSLNWLRSRLVEFHLPKDRELFDPTSGRTIPVEQLPAPAGSAGSGEEERRIRFLAADVPGIGYRCYGIRPAGGPGAEPASGAGNTLENAYYRIRLDPESGSIASMFDKELQRELIDGASPYRLNQFVEATGSQERGNAAGLSTTIAPPPNFQIQTAARGRLASLTRTSFGSVARLEASAPNHPRIATEIILFDGQKKIEITNRVQRERGPTDEWGYFAFPFALQRPEFRYEVQNGVVDPARDILPGGAREWSVVQHWVAADEGDVTVALVPVDAPLVAFGDIIRWRWPKEFGTRKATLFSYAFKGSEAGQDLTLRYVLTSGRRLTSGALSKLGWEAMSPFELNEIVPTDKVGKPSGPLNPAQASFVQVDQPSVVLVTWKVAEDERGTIMRFVETDGQPHPVKVTMPVLNLEKGWLCNGVEENQQPLTVSGDSFRFNIKAHEIVTVRLEGTSRPKE